MDRVALRNAAVRYGLLFLISVVLVIGFWYHREFYQIGFLPLVLIGGGVTFLVLLSLRALNQGGLWKVRPRGSLPLPRDATERVLAGTQTLAILPLAADLPSAGSATRVVIAGSAVPRPVALVRIRDVRRRLAADIREEEAIAAGFDGVHGFRSAGGRKGTWDPCALLALVEFRREGKA